MDEEQRNRKRAQMVASYITLPFVLAISPIVGWFIGSWLDKHFGIAPYAMIFFIVLGMLAGGREFYRIVTNYQDDEM